MRGKTCVAGLCFCLSLGFGFAQQADSGEASQADTTKLEEFQKAQQQIQVQLQELRKDLEAAQLQTDARQQLEKRLSALELAQAQLAARLDDLQKATATPLTTVAPPEQPNIPAQVQAQQPPAIPSGGQASPVDNAGLTPLDLGTPGAGTGQVSSGTAFNPAISVIPDMVYYNDNHSGQGLDLLSRADGFPIGNPSAGHGVEFSPGFNLRELEVTFSASVDPYIDVLAILSTSKDGAELEEVYGRTRSLPAGLQLKFGKFFSDIGYINSQHPHQWDFVNQNLAYQFLLDGGLNDTGVQLSWLPSLPVYVRLGAEAFQGDNEALARYVGPGATTPFFTSRGGPRLFDGFFKVAPDLGYNHALQAGLFAGSARRDQEEQPEIALEGTSWFAGTDWVYKYDSPREYGKGDLTLQAEYIYRVKDLSVVNSSDTLLLGQPQRYVQDGFYLQGVYGFAERFTAAARFDAGGLTNRIERGGVLPLELKDSHRASFNITFNPTHFSRLRLQYDRDAASIGGLRESFNQVFLQAQFSLGVHGAHKF